MGLARVPEGPGRPAARRARDRLRPGAHRPHHDAHEPRPPRLLWRRPAGRQVADGRAPDRLPRHQEAHLDAGARRVVHDPHHRGRAHAGQGDPRLRQGAAPVEAEPARHDRPAAHEGHHRAHEPDADPGLHRLVQDLARLLARGGVRRRDRVLGERRDLDEPGQGDPDRHPPRAHDHARAADHHQHALQPARRAVGRVQAVLGPGRRRRHLLEGVLARHEPLARPGRDPGRHRRRSRGRVGRVPRRVPHRPRGVHQRGTDRLGRDPRGVAICPTTPRRSTMPSRTRPVARPAATPIRSRSATPRRM